ncbi:type VI secretion protein [Streptomyces carpaticus]|uniref:Type VI secretion protein n=1 Tax=Streptomyces carpaticus TaxID=285558 RepID=A0ABV4ZS95_9ACTN
MSTSTPPPSQPPARRGGGVPDALLVGGLGFVLGLTVLTWTATGVAGWVAHGAWPDGVTFLRTATALRHFLTEPGDVAGAWPQADPETLPGAGLLWLIFLVLVIMLFGGVLWIAIRVARWRARPARHQQEHARGQEQAAGTEYAAPAAPAPANHPAPAAQPAPVPRTFEPPHPQQPTATSATPVHSPVPAPAADPVAAVLAAPEGLIVLDPDGRLWTKTATRRGKQGPVHVYDPGHASDAPVRLRWAPQRGAEDMPAARSRAKALLGPVRPTEPIFQLDAETAETLLRCYLHAAALAAEPIQQVQRWAQGKAAGDPGKILRTHPRAAGGASMELESALSSLPERRDAALVLIGRALEGLDQLHIRQSCSPGRVDTLALDNLANEGGTLYVIGNHAPTAPFRAALVDALTSEQPKLTVIGA